MKLMRLDRLKPLERTILTIGLLFVAKLGFADSEYAQAWGPSVGAIAPMLSAKDQDGTQQDLNSLSGSQGLLLVFNRSVDW